MILDEQESIAINVEDNDDGCDVATCPNCQTRFYLEYPEMDAKDGCIFLIIDTVYRLIGGTLIFTAGSILLFLFFVYVLPKLGF